MTASCASWVATPELYPTEMRATGHSVCVAWSRVGGFTTPYLVISSTSNLVVGLIIGLFCIIIGLATMKLPETTGK
jgi:hypothetical protein